MNRAEIVALVIVVLGGAGWATNKIFKLADHNRDRIAAVEQKAAVTGALVERFHPTPQ